MATKESAIGVFDSGVGGLTVLHALREVLPHEQFIYLGDTARLPYGTKSKETIQAYAIQAAELLRQHDIKLLVVACNTASALALEAVQAHCPDIPVLGVLEPGACAAHQATQTGCIGLLATESTIQSKGYVHAIQEMRPDAKIIEQACSLFVAIAEEGWADSIVARETAKQYLKQFDKESDLDCIVLGCTHFPVLQQVIAEQLGERITIVDSATSTAQQVQQLLQSNDLCCTRSAPIQNQFMVTDSPERFSKMANIFLGESIQAEYVEPIRV